MSQIYGAILTNQARDKRSRRHSNLSSVSYIEWQALLGSLAPSPKLEAAIARASGEALTSEESRRSLEEKLAPYNTTVSPRTFKFSI